MKTTGLFQVLVTGDVAASRAFYEKHFGFRPVFVAPWYVHLLHPEQPALQLGVVAAGHSSVPAGDQLPNRSTIVTVQVDEVDVAFDSLRSAEVPVLLPPRDEPWGQRHFLALDPGGFVVDVVMAMEPNAEYADSYLPQSP